jgi:peroxiredoxin
MVIKKGKNPNAFILKDQDGNDIAISDYNDSYKLLSFHPLAWTSVCAKQMKSIEDNYEKFKKLVNIQIHLNNN